MKTIKTLVATAALITVPGLAAAQMCGYDKTQSATVTCAPGSTFDSQSGVCLPDATG